MTILSVPEEVFESVKALMLRFQFNYVQLVSVPNRGRDVAHFVLSLLTLARKIGYKYFLKLHTKKSTHLSSSSRRLAWSNHLIDSLTDVDNFLTYYDYIQNSAAPFLFTPAATLLPLGVALSKNVFHWITF